VILVEFSFLSSLYFWLSVLWCRAGKYFLLLCGWSFQFKYHFFVVQKLFNFMKSHLSILSLSYWAASFLY
jgi:hypothetical protein